MDYKERQRILEEPFKIFPTVEGMTYGPNKKQIPLFINRFSHAQRVERSTLPYTDFNRLHTHTQDIVLAIGGSRSGKCLKIDTELILANGELVKVQNIKVGDLLLGPDSLPRKVVSLARGRETMYKVTPNKGEPFTCNESHILSLKTSSYRLLTYREGGKRSEVHSNGEIRNMSVLDYLNLSKRNQNSLKLWRPGAVRFSGEVIPDLDPYFLGVWLGDGHANSTSITSADEEVVSYLYDYAEELGLKIHKSPAGGISNSYHLSAGNVGGGRNKLFTKLKSYNLIGNKHIPLIFKTSTIPDRLQILAGLLDTDGHLSKGLYYEITQKNKALADDIAFLARSLGFSASIKEVRKHCMYKGEKREGTYHRVNIWGDLEFIPTKIARKKATRLKHRTDHHVTGFKLEKLPEDDYYGFELEGPDRLFLLGDFTVTHNTVGAVAVVIDTLLRYPGAQAIIGAKTYQDLKDTSLEEWRKRFTVHKSWDHPLVESKPTDHSKVLRLTNGSFARFLHFDDFERLRGREASIIHLDEASQLDDARAFQELIRRSSGSKVPTRQFLLTTNPPESDNWLQPTFSLKQLEPGYQGPIIPMGEPCTCQYCQSCLNSLREEIEWEYPTLPDPAGPIGTCPNCGAIKSTNCIGNQSFFRVIQSSALDNQDALPSDYVQTLKAGMDEATYKLYALGELIMLREGKVFKGFGRGNVLTFNKELDLEKEIHWTFDFNISYQCSAIIQTMNTVQGLVGEILDEIVLPESGPEDVAKEFMLRYPMYSRVNNPKAPAILLYGDPAGLNRSTSGNERSKFQIVYDVLTAGGYEVEMVIRKIKGNTQIPLMHSIDAMNTMLCNAEGLRRLFINPKCEYTLKSIESTRYKQSGEHPTIDKQCDDNAARNPDKRKVQMLTHPGDAVRYWVVKCDPVLREASQDPYIQIPGEGVIKISPNGTVIHQDSRGNEEEADRGWSLQDHIAEISGLPDLFWGL